MLNRVIFSLCFLSLCSVNFAKNILFRNSDQVLSFVKKHLPDNPVILEAGGHYGEDTRRMKRFWKNSVICVFEALPSSCEKFISNTTDLADVFLYPYALSTYVGTTNFYVNPTNDGSSSINQPVGFNQHEFEKIPIEVNCTTLDVWSKKQNISHVDFMWLDMEGHELYVLQNALNILGSVKAIYTEVNFVPVRQGACLYKDLKKFLEAHGFKEVGKCGVSRRFGNALFIR